MHNNEGIQKEILITLHETPGIGWHTIRKAVEYGAWQSYERYIAGCLDIFSWTAS